MRQNDHLTRDACELPDELLRTRSPEPVQTGEWVIEDYNFTADLRVLFECGQKESQSQRTSVAGTQGAFETGNAGLGS